MNKDMAYVYRGLATHHNPFELKVQEFDRSFNPHTDPGTMFSLGGPVITPGDKITISYNSEALSDVEKIDVFNGSEKMGGIQPGNNPELDFMGEVLPHLLKEENPVYGYVTQAFWYDVLSTEAYEKLDQKMVDDMFKDILS